MRLRRCALAAIVALLLLSGTFIRPTATRAIGLWTPAAPLPEPFDANSREYVSASLLRDGDVLVTSNAIFFSDRISSPKTARYNPTTDTWSRASGMTVTRSGYASALLPNGQLLVVGGYTRVSDRDLPRLATAERYDPVTDRWLPAASLHTPRTGATATPLLDGRVLVIGGQDDRYKGLASAELYDPATDSWTVTGQLTVRRERASVTRLPGGRVLVVGGVDERYEPLASAELYDPATNRWVAITPPRAIRGGHRAILLPTGQVLAFASNAAERYDPATDRWTPSAPLPTVLSRDSYSPSGYSELPREGYSSTLLPSGQVLVAGGETCPLACSQHNVPVPLASTQLYDPATDRWAAGPPLGVARAGHTATLLPDGQLLVVGGSYQTYKNLSGVPTTVFVTATERYSESNIPAYCPPETGKCVQGQFLAYWQAHGGLAINGYPLSDERIEILDDGKPYIVQYFERVRMEYHPENKSPHDVLLGQFGRIVYVSRTGRGTDPPAPSVPGARYFPQTGHNLAGSFRRFWEANGGEAQFGFPLGEERREVLEDGNEYTVQYFERARFEYHPGETPVDVQLGQFGRYILALPKP